eukprot:6191855-Pleurochrysis_carterae.AAC.2
MRRGYAAVHAARAAPSTSLPCATAACLPMQCVHLAPASVSIMRPVSPRARTTVLYLCAVAPSAHCTEQVHYVYQDV